MSDEAAEIRKQFAVYADAITAFATVQVVGLMLLMAHGDCFTRNVLGGLWYTVCIGVVINIVYLIVVFLCHQAADKIHKPTVAIAPALRSVQMLRYVIIVTDLLVTILLPLAINYGWHHGQFFIDCKGT